VLLLSVLNANLASPGTHAMCVALQESDALQSEVALLTADRARLTREVRRDGHAHEAFSSFSSRQREKHSVMMPNCNHHSISHGRWLIYRMLHPVNTATAAVY